MLLEISPETGRLVEAEATRLGLSVDRLLQQLVKPAATDPLPELPSLHLGPMGRLDREEIYADRAL